MAKKTAKTNAMRILDRAGISYQTYTYESEDGVIDGISVAEKLNQPLSQVFKTLVTVGHSGEYHVFVIPVAAELDLKAAAKAVGEKSVEMIPVKEINRVTGYIRGGCSANWNEKAVCHLRGQKLSESGYHHFQRREDRLSD